MRNLFDNIPNCPNFSWYEFIKSNIGKKLNIENFPQDESIWNNIELICKECIQPIRNHFGPIIINSGYRNSILNTAVKGSITSLHLTGQAVDFEPLNDKIKYVDIIEWIKNNLRFYDIIYEYPPMGWIHISYCKDKNCLNKIKLKDNKHNYSEVTIDYLKKYLG